MQETLFEVLCVPMSTVDCVHISAQENVQEQLTEPKDTGRGVRT